MRGLLAVVAGLAAVVSVTANCPNACSGHGDCSTNHDFCSCYAGFIGADCSERLCPFGLAYIDLPQGDLDHDNALNSGGRDKDATTTAIPAGTTIDGETTGAVVNPQWRGQGWWERHPSQLYGSIEQAAGLPFHVRDNEGHFYAECSSQGICDRSSGLCECFPGYEGGACNRTTCPNDCSGHGVCRTTAETLPAGIAYNLWDAPKYQHCVCDGGFDGLDCSMRVCPRGDDPLTTTTTVVGYNNGIAESGEIQYIDVRCSYGGSMLDANVALVYTDATTGDSYETSWIDPTDTSASNGDAIVAALRALPNDVLSEFVVDGSTVDTYSKVLSASVSELEENQFYRIAVTFAAAFGDVPMLSARAHENFICKGGLKVDTRYGTKTDVYENIAAYVVGDGPREHLRIEIDIADEASGSIFTYTIADKDGNVYNNADAATHTPTNTTAGTGEMLSGAAAFTREATKIAFHWQFGDGIEGRGDMGVDAGLTYLLEYVVDPVISSSHHRFDFNGTAAILTTAPVWTNQTNTTGASDSLVFSAPEDTNPLYDLSVRLVALAGSDVDNETYAIYVNGEFVAYFEGEFPDSVSDGADLFSLIDVAFAAGVPANGKNWIGNVTFSAAGTVYGGDEWNFHLPKLPKVYNATGPDEIGVVFLNDDAVDVTVPLVIKILSVSSNPDMYAWKVAGDAAWTDNNGAGYAIPSITNATALGGAEDYAAANAADPVRSQVANILLEWNSGADFDARICSTATNGAYYYIQIGSNGLNDRPECSGRGVCDYSSGRCQCFTGYSGLACSEQNALARGGFGRVVSV